MAGVLPGAFPDLRPDSPKHYSSEARAGVVDRWSERLDPSWPGGVPVVPADVYLADLGAGALFRPEEPNPIMSESFRFSPRPNRAAEVRWRAWGAAALEEAAASDRPVFLHLTAVWCQWCHRMDENAFSDPEVIRLLNDEFVPIRVDADRMPHVQDRYIAGGWPTNAFLTPTGAVLWAGTYVEADALRTIARGVLEAWRGRRDELEAEIDRRTKALEAARSRQNAAGLVRHEAADTVLATLQDAFDARNGGFGNAPKFPSAEAIELLFARGVVDGNPDWLLMAERTLDGILAGTLHDEVEGGFFRYALEADWTSPRHEKLLEVNAALLSAFALGAHVSGREDWRAVAERVVNWAEGALRRPDGLWGGSQDADEEYYHLDEDGRRARPHPAVDLTLYADANAAWIRALADAGARLGRADWVARAERALEALLQRMVAPSGLVFHYAEPDSEPRLEGLLNDSLEVGRACLAVAQATGREDFVRQAARLADAMQDALWESGGGFIDHVPGPDDVGALRYRDRPFDRNAAAARLFLDLADVTAQRGYRAIAERILALLSPKAGRYGIAAAEFALAVEEFFDPPVRIAVVGDPEEAAPLRAAALSLPLPARRVWTLPEGGHLGAHVIDADDRPAAFVCGAKTCSPPIRDAAALGDAVLAVR